MLNKEIIQRVSSLYSKGVQNNDVRLMKRHIYNKLITSRNILIVNQSNKRQRISLECYQTLSCIEMSEVNKTDCNCIPDFIKNNYKIYRSEKQIPEVLRSIFNYLIIGVYTLDNYIKFDHVDYSDIKYYNGRKYGTFKPFTFIHNNYLYLINAEYQLIEMSAIFAQPLDVLEFNSCGCDEVVDCESYNDKAFPISSNLIEPLLAMTKQEMIVEFQYGKIDKSNNAQDNSNLQQEEAE